MIDAIDLIPFTNLAALTGREALNWQFGNAFKLMLWQLGNGGSAHTAIDSVPNCMYIQVYTYVCTIWL